LSNRSRTPVTLVSEESENDIRFHWSPSRSVQTLSLPEQIAEAIGNAIIRGELEPGQRIQEQNIATQFEVSRGPVRESLRILERDGMVRILPRRGAQVTLLSIDEVNDVFTIRASLIGLAARLIAERQDQMLIAELKQHAETLARLANDGNDVDRYVKSSYMLSMTMASGCGNPRLRDLIYSLAHQTVRYSRLSLSTPERRRQSAKNTKILVRNLVKGDLLQAQLSAETLVLDSRAAAIALLKASDAKKTRTSH
jgi:DNA-binding GntR family transcriptional regulator